MGFELASIQDDVIVTGHLCKVTVTRSRGHEFGGTLLEAGRRGLEPGLSATASPALPRTAQARASLARCGQSRALELPTQVRAGLDREAHKPQAALPLESPCRWHMLPGTTTGAPLHQLTPSSSSLSHDGVVPGSDLQPDGAVGHTLFARSSGRGNCPCSIRYDVERVKAQGTFGWGVPALRPVP